MTFLIEANSLIMVQGIAINGGKHEYNYRHYYCTEYAGTNLRMDSIVLEDTEYQELLADIDAATEKVNMDKNIDKILSAYNAAHAYYNKKCYQQGLIDCATFLKELGII